jgi:hypothetical protein
MELRTKWIDPDFRRDAKTMCYCEVCQRDLKEGQPRREIRFEIDRYEAIHPDDWDKATETGRAIHAGLIGMDCAKRLGLEWTR